MVSAQTVPDIDRITDAMAPLRLANRRVGCDVIVSFGDLLHLREEWDALVEALDCPVYLTFDWCRIWWEHYGAWRDLRIFIFRDGNEVVGVVPMYVDRVRIGPFGARLAKIVGTDCTPVSCDLPIQREWSDAAIDAMVRRLLLDDRCDAVAIGPITSRSPHLAALRTVAEQHPDLVRLHRERSAATESMIDLRGTFDDYVATLSPNERSNIRKAARRLTSDFDVDIELVRDPAEVSSEFHEFMRMHRLQWRQQGRLGHFEDWPGAERFNRALVVAMSRLDRVRLLRVRADGRVVARQYGFMFGNTCYWRLPARLTGRRWERYSLGRSSLLELIRQAIDEGATRLDAGVGFAEHKRRLGAVRSDVRSVLLVLNRPPALRRVRPLCVIADWLDRWYYRGWFQQIAPRLPGRQRRLWKAWARSRF